MDEPLTPKEREALIRWLINTHALSDIHIPRDVAEQAVDEAYALPLIDVNEPFDKDRP